MRGRTSPKLHPGTRLNVAARLDRHSRSGDRRARAIPSPPFPGNRRQVPRTTARVWPRMDWCSRLRRRNRVDIGRRGLRHRGRRRRRRRRRGLGRHDFPSVGGWLDRARARSRQEEQRVEVPLLVARSPDPEIDVRDVQLGHSARADGPHRLALAHCGSSPHAERPEVHERDGVAVLGLDRHDPAAAGDGARERDRSRGRCADGSSGGGADVDSAVLACRVRVGGIEGEPDQHRSCHRPGPAESRSRDDQGGGSRGNEHTHLDRPPLSSMQTP
jgi:hypothetical protein